VLWQGFLSSLIPDSCSGEGHLGLADEEAELLPGGISALKFGRALKA
jgi:hypothetical protein